MQHLPAADGITVYKGNHGYRQRADLALQVQDVQSGEPVPADIAAVAANVLIAAGTEGLVARPGQ